MGCVVNLSGQSFGRLTALSRAENAGRHTRWNCACQCGATVVVKTGSLQSGNTTSCGCFRRECTGAMFSKHGMKSAPEYGAWSLMRDRCNNQGNKSFAWYGGAVISVCKQWDDFSVFLSDMGSRPTSLHTIDRIDPAGNYEPENCRWATRKEQSRNRTNTKLVTFNGSTKPLGEWAERVGIPYGVLNKRLWRGWSVDSAFSQQTKGA